MPYYKNLGFHDATYYGISAKPGEVAYFPGNVMDKFMIQVKNPKKQEHSNQCNIPKTLSVNRKRKNKQNANNEKETQSKVEPVTDISMCDSVKVSNVVKNNLSDKEDNDSSVVEERDSVSLES